MGWEGVREIRVRDKGERGERRGERGGEKQGYHTVVFSKTSISQPIPCHPSPFP